MGKIAVLGADSYIGKYLLKKERQKALDSIGTSRRDKRASLKFLDYNAPNLEKLKLTDSGHDAAIIAAGVTNVKVCENDKKLSKAINVEGTLKIVKALIDEGVKPIFLSSDYVFDGSRGGYVESAERWPSSMYGQQKKEVENRIMDLSNNILIIRMSKVYGLSKGDGTLLDNMAKALSLGEKVLAANDQIFCPTYIEDIARGIFLLHEQKFSGVVHCCAPDACSRFDLAKMLASELGVSEESVQSISIHDVPDYIRRPKNTSMITSNFFLDNDCSFLTINEAISQVATNWKKYG